MAINVIPSAANKIVSKSGKEFKSIRSLAKALKVNRESVSAHFKKYNCYMHDGETYYLDSATIYDKEKNFVDATQLSPDVEFDKEEYEEFLEQKKVKELPFTIDNFKFSHLKEGNRYAVALFSDAHIEETVEPDAVLGLNRYDINIAKERIQKYFCNLTNCLNEDKVEDLIFASLGDTITGYLRAEQEQTNGLSPLEATEVAQNIIYNGLRYLCEHATFLKHIKFIGIVGNHSRTTKKIQHINGYKMSYEWLMYRNIQKQCELTNLPIDFCIPNSEMAIVDTQDKKRFIFIHGFT